MRLFIIQVKYVLSKDNNIFTDILDIVDYTDLKESIFSISLLNKHPLFKEKNYPMFSKADSDAIKNHGRTVITYLNRNLFDMLFDLDHPNSHWTKSIVRDISIDNLLN